MVSQLNYQLQPAFLKLCPTLRQYDFTTLYPYIPPQQHLSLQKKLRNHVQYATICNMQYILKHVNPKRVCNTNPICNLTLIFIIFGVIFLILFLACNVSSFCNIMIWLFCCCCCCPVATNPCRVLLSHRYINL